MTTELRTKLGDMEYDGLIAAITPAPQVSSGTIRKLGTKAVLKRGTILAKSSTDAKLVVLGSTAASSETLTADCVLCDDIEVGTTDDETVPVYMAGCFNPDKVTVKSGYTITEDDKDDLRMRGIVFKSVAEA